MGGLSLNFWIKTSGFIKVFLQIYIIYNRYDSTSIIALHKP